MALLHARRGAGLPIPISMRDVAAFRTYANGDIKAS